MADHECGESFEIDDEIIRAASVEEPFNVVHLPSSATDSSSDDDSSDTNTEIHGDAVTEIPVEQIDDHDEAAPTSRKYNTKQKKKWLIIALLALMALVLIIGLGAGLGTRKKDNNGLNGVSSSNANAQGEGMTYEECLAQREKEQEDDEDDEKEEEEKFITQNSFTSTVATPSSEQTPFPTTYFSTTSSSEFAQQRGETFFPTTPSPTTPSPTMVSTGSSSSTTVQQQEGNGSGGGAEDGDEEEEEEEANIQANSNDLQNFAWTFDASFGNTGGDDGDSSGGRRRRDLRGSSNSRSHSNSGTEGSAKRRKLECEELLKDHHTSAKSSKKTSTGSAKSTKTSTSKPKSKSSKKPPKDEDDAPTLTYSNDLSLGGSDDVDDKPTPSGAPTTPKMATSNCIIQVVDYLMDPNYFGLDTSEEEGGTAFTINPEEEGFNDQEFDCELDPSDADGTSGIMKTLVMDTEQTAAMKSMLATGALVPGRSMLKISSASSGGNTAGDADGDGAGNFDGTAQLPSGGVEMDDGEIKVPSGANMMFLVDTPEDSGVADIVIADDEEEKKPEKISAGDAEEEKKEKPEKEPFRRGRTLKDMNENSKNSRELQNVVTKRILVVKVIDVNGLARPESPQQMSDDVFGTDGDSLNLKSQLEACSMGKWKVEAGIPQDSNKYAAPGVMQITMPISLKDAVSTRSFQNAVTSKLTSLLNLDSLPGPYDHIMYVLEKCYVNCGWAAYAYIGGYLSVYQGGFYKMPGVQIHEMGHNFRLAHSGELGGGAYTDWTGSMGNPSYADDARKMCYNAAKSWQIGWYDDRKASFNPLGEPGNRRLKIKMVGIADYKTAATDDLPVVVKLNTSTEKDYYIAFNRASGVNEEVRKGGNLVTIVETGKEGADYAQSTLRASIDVGQEHTILDFGGSGKDVVISVESIDKSSGPWKATIDVGVGPPPAPCDAGKVRFKVTTITDNWPAETEWKLTNLSTNDEPERSKPYTKKNTWYSDYLCIDTDRYKFEMLDSYGDGLCCGYGEGSFKAEYNGNVVLLGGEFASNTTKFFGPQCS